MSRIFSLIFVFFFCINASALAQDNKYKIENIPVSVSAENPAAAKNLAVKTAHQNAFLTLLSRLNLDSAIASKVNSDEISDMVRSEHISGEKLLGNNYSAIFNITFSKDFVDHILDKKSLKKERNTTYLLLPVKLSGKKVLLWEDANNWRKAVEKQLLENGGNKMILPYNDIENVRVANRSNILNSTYSDLKPMLERYKAAGAYLLFFSPDEEENKVRVDISYIARMQGKQIKLNFTNTKSIDNNALIEKVAQKTVSYLSDLEIDDINKIGDLKLTFAVKINSLGNWLMIKNKIENSGLVNQLDISSFSRNEVIIKVAYVGTNPNIAQAFADIGLSLKEKDAGFYILKAN